MKKERKWRWNKRGTDRQDWANSADTFKNLKKTL